MRSAKPRFGAWLAAAATIVLACGLPACGGRETPAAAPTPTPAPPPTPAPARLGDLSASVTSVEGGTRINCVHEVHARVTLANQAAISVAVTGVRMTSTIVSGHCSPAAQFTFTPAARAAPGGSSTVVLDRALFGSGSGCCGAPGCAGICG